MNRGLVISITNGAGKCQGVFDALRRQQDIVAFAQAAFQIERSGVFLLLLQLSASFILFPGSKNVNAKKEIYG